MANIVSTTLFTDDTTKIESYTLAGTYGPVEVVKIGDVTVFGDAAFLSRLEDAISAHITQAALDASEARKVAA